ncbi:hypothetical protein GQ53DRAFT_425277 [Thozetella sp. PMI_491]|nr:hypothetical protein GQ53DRAFT_425277 [Thozetella sp. PMI_491]
MAQGSLTRIHLQPSLSLAMVRPTLVISWSGALAKPQNLIGCTLLCISYYEHSSGCIFTMIRDMGRVVPRVGYRASSEKAYRT